MQDATCCSTCGGPVSPARPAHPGMLPRSVRDDATVDEITRRSPRALAVLRDFGINHCCGAHLTLTQAAAAAGVPLERLVRALDDAIHTEA